MASVSEKPRVAMRADFREIVLDDRVGHEGGAVDQVVHVRPFEIDGAERGEQTGYAVVGAGGNLGDPRIGMRSAHRDHVSERAADIDSDLPSARHDGSPRIQSK